MFASSVMLSSTDPDILLASTKVCNYNNMYIVIEAEMIVIYPHID